MQDRSYKYKAERESDPDRATVNLEPEEKAFLRAMSERSGISESQILRNGLANEIACSMDIDDPTYKAKAKA